MSASVIAIALAASTVGGQTILAPLMELARRMLGKPTQRLWWVSFVVAMTERAIATTLVIWAPGSIALFIGGWTVAKFAAGWGRIPNSTPHVPASHLIALVGTAASFAIAIAAGIWANPASLAVLAKVGTSN